MSTVDTVRAVENTGSHYTEPSVQAFYGMAINALEDAPDGASAATRITGEYQRQHLSWVQSNNALHNDIRRLSADEGAKAAMLTQAGTFAGRMIAEHTRLVGQLHGHQSVESQLHELARQLEETAPGVAEQIRDILTGITPVPALPVQPIVLAATIDPRWHCGWFRRTDRPTGHPLEPLPFAGWVTVAEDPQSPSQCVESAFLHHGTWYTKRELDQRGMRLERID